MNERELLKKTLKEHYLDKEKILKNSTCNPPVLEAKMEGTMYMKKHMIALISLIILLCLSTVTVFAVTKILSAREAAEIIGNPLIASAFEGENSTKIDKSFTEDGYTISLLGITSGSNLNDFVDNTDKSYAVIAVANSDGTPITEFDSLFVSPLVKGLNPALYNIATFNGSFSGEIDNGIVYHMIECDNIEMFADRGIYLCVTTTGLYDSHAFTFDKTSGIIAPDPSYIGLNVLFDLPIDTAKAEPEKAQDYIDHLFEPDPNAAPIPDDKKTTDVPMTADGKPDIAAIISTCELLEDSKQNIKTNKYDEFVYTYTDEGGRSSSTSLASIIFEERKIGVPFLEMSFVGGDETSRTFWYLIYTLQSDNSIDAAMYEIVKPI